MTNKTAPASEIYPTALQLAQMMKDDEDLVQEGLLALGSELIQFEEDARYPDTFANLHDLKMEAIRLGMEDLAIGGPTLRTNAIAVVLKDGRLESRIAPQFTGEEVEILFSLSLNRHRDLSLEADNEDALTQEQINSSLYYLTVKLSRVI